MKVRTRIAPSPTGMLHIGTARTALFNYLFAKKHNGEFCLRIEDTDVARNTKESYDAILDGLGWLGINYNGDVVYQSARSDLYHTYIKKLLDNKIAYYSYISDDEIQKRKEEAEKNNGRYIHRYSGEDEIVNSNIKPVVRLKVKGGVSIVIEDVVQGRVVINSDTVEDFVLLRSDGSPVYMLAVVCDDIDMQITHVIRGVDHLTNTAKQVLLYNAFGVNLPVFAHIPLIHGEDGAKLSKRHGAVSTLEYKNQGFLPEAVCSYLLRLGWSNGNDDILNEKEAIAVFNLEGIGRSPSRFDDAKLKSVNEFFIKNSENSHLIKVLESDYNFDCSVVFNPENALNVMKNRSKTLLELIDGLLLFKKEMSYSAEIDSNKVKKIQEFMQLVGSEEDISNKFKLFLEENNLKFKDLGHEFRILLLGCVSSIGVFEIISVFGIEEAKKRIFSYKI